MAKSVILTVIAGFEKWADVWLNLSQEMALTLLSIFLITISGACVTYLYGKDGSLLARLAAGNVIGQAVWATVGFVIFCFFGFSMPAMLIALGLTAMPLILLLRADVRENLLSEFERAKAALNSIRIVTILNAAWYIFWGMLFYFFFVRAMIERPEGIFTGASQNLGDLPFHLAAITSFVYGGNFPPENPSMALTTFTYPFLTDLVAAYFVKFGASLSSALLVQNFTLACSLFVILESFVVRITGSKMAARFAILIFFFSGGLGFVRFFQDYWVDGRGLSEFLLNLPRDYTIGEKTLRWGNPMVVLFITQRSFLLGMPIVIIALEKLWQIFTREETSDDEAQLRSAYLEMIVIGLLSGTLVLIHSYSLAALFIVCAFLFFFALKKWREWLVYAAATGVTAIPMLVWFMRGSVTRASEFFTWYPGWEAIYRNYFVFWAINLGIFIPMLVGGFLLILWRRRHGPDNRHYMQMIKFYAPFAAIFILTNLTKLAPWQWDNIKLMIYWFIGSIVLVGLLLAEFWKKGKLYKLGVSAALLVLVMSGALDVWRVISESINYEVFNLKSVKLAEEIKLKTPPNALFLNEPTYNTPVVLTGRRSVLRYTAHLMSHGIDSKQREQDVDTMYRGNGTAEILFRTYGVDYVIISPQEYGRPGLNFVYFESLPMVAKFGEYGVYQIKK